MVTDGPDGALLRVKVSPGARRERILGVHGDALKVAVRAPPEKGRANRAIERLLAEACGRRARDVAVVAGAAARLKTVRFRGVSAAALRTALESIC